MVAESEIMTFRLEVGTIGIFWVRMLLWDSNILAIVFIIG
jgi:hypothetical protein